ncbi:MAG: nucleoside triphosphate pyrophosphohydrolase family protein [Scytonema sp. PMC 1069.18]|nr:nucleoside triphosphate pyrophosphohydrolase family protein [Scytonema sp. PMC 1069.18]MEC4884981.1 nucleoside triphosphate pyrophosphohydrolase family protein [Scytonema sp. PMC 1070.18]
MHFQEYQERLTIVSNAYGISDPDKDLAVCIIGLAGEVGEVCELVKKDIRDNSIDLNCLKKELGDVLAYVSQVARCYGLKLEDIAQTNVEKLESRMNRGTLRGNGNNR